MGKDVYSVGGEAFSLGIMSRSGVLWLRIGQFMDSL